MNPPGYRHTALEIKCYSHITSVKDLIGASRKEFIMSTEENAQKAFAGESQANRKYSAFAEKAGAEGYSTVAKIFKAASEAEAIHAKRILFILDAVGTTEENLKTAMEGENYEFTEMYPAFVAEAKKERKTEASIVFTHAMRAEEVHANIYLQALEAVRDGKTWMRRRSSSAPSAATSNSARHRRSAPSAVFRNGCSARSSNPSSSFQPDLTPLSPRKLNTLSVLFLHHGRREGLHD